MSSPEKNSSESDPTPAQTSARDPLATTDGGLVTNPPAQAPSGGGLSFGTNPPSQAPSGGGLSFGTNPASHGSGFGTTPASQGSVFGTTPASQRSGFGTATASQGSGFGTTPASQGSGFGTTPASQRSGFGTATASQGSLFGTTTPAPQGSGFGTTSAPQGFCNGNGGGNVFGGDGARGQFGGGGGQFGGGGGQFGGGGTQFGGGVGQFGGGGAQFGGGGGGGRGLFGGGGAGGGKNPAKASGKPQTWFYLVCGGGIVHDKEKQSREQMKMVYNTIIEKGLAKEDHILVVRGRGKELVSSSPSNDFVTNGGSFKMYGPVYSQQGGFTFGGPTPSGVPLPSARDNAVVVFIGQGYYQQTLQQQQGLFGGQPFNKSNPEFGDLVFVDSFSNETVYQPQLAHLKGKNTLLISVADYCGESFERAFKKAASRNPNQELLAVCLSEHLHVPSDQCLGKAFAQFFEDEMWKERSIGDFCQLLEDKYEGHPAVFEMKENVINYNQETYEEVLEETSKWATGTFEALVCRPIPTYNWEMFRMVENLKESVNEASVTELSTDMKQNLDQFITKMEDMRMEAIETNLHRPKPYQIVGDRDMASMTWKTFLKLD